MQEKHNWGSYKGLQCPHKWSNVFMNFVWYFYDVLRWFIRFLLGFYDHFWTSGQCDAFTTITHEFEDFLNPNEWLYQIYTCRYLTWCCVLIGHGRDWLSQCQDNVTRYQVTVSVAWFPNEAALQSRHERTVPMLILLSMLPGCKTSTINQRQS